MADENSVVPVVLRIWRDDARTFAFFPREDKAFVLFPTLPSDNYGRYCDAYAHIGQHGGADYHSCIRHSRPVKGNEGMDLLRELEQIGYRLRVVKRATRVMHDERKAEATRLERLRHEMETNT